MERSAHLDSFARDNLPPEDEWPELLLDNPDVAYPARLNCAAALLDGAIAAGHGERVAIWSEHDCIPHAPHVPHATSYAALQELVDHAAQVLTDDLGLVPGNRVLLRGANTLSMAVALLACLRAGMVAVPTMPLLRSKELRQIIDKAQIGAALCDIRLLDELAHCTTAGHADFCPGLRQICTFHHDGADSLDRLAAAKTASRGACDTAIDDVCLIAFTSGTTGEPKGCMHFHRDLLAMCDLFPRHVLGISKDDIVCGTPPLAFTFGLGGLLCFPLRVGASTVLLERPNPESLLRAAERFGATIMFTAPTNYRQMAALWPKVNAPTLRKCVSAGEALPDATRQSWRNATGIEMIDGIGGTEMIHIFVSAAAGKVPHVPHAIGRAVPGYVVAVLDEDLQPVAPGVIGRLAVKGPTGCRYLADARQRKFVSHGWNLTGDSARLDEHGNVFYQARTDDMIVSAGYNISGPEVEDALLRHPAVAECGVIGLPDEERGQVVAAFIVLRPGHAPGAELADALQRFVKETIAPYKYPRRISFIDELPRTETGKLKRFALRNP